MPLLKSFQLSSKKGKEAYLFPDIDRSTNPPEINFNINLNGKFSNGTVGRKGAYCLTCEQPVSLEYVRSEGRAGRIGQKIVSIVVDAERRRLYLPSDKIHEKMAFSVERPFMPETELPCKSGIINTPLYGLSKHSDLFTDRQLKTLVTFTDLLKEVSELLHEDGAGKDYTDAIILYLGLGVSKLADALSSLTRWKPSMDQAIATFARQAFPMVWDYAESNTFNGAAGDYETTIKTIFRTLSEINSKTPNNGNRPRKVKKS
jgi:putative DNA methylase